MPKKNPLKHLPCSFRGYNLSRALGSGYGLTSLLLLDMKSVSTENLSQSWPRLVLLLDMKSVSTENLLESWPRLVPI